MGNRIIVAVCLSFIFFGCRSSFYHLSKSISAAYNDEELARYDVLYNHPFRMKIRHGNSIDSYNIDEDTLTFLQYSNRHDGEIGTVIVLNRRVIFPFSDVNQYGETDTGLFSTMFLDALVKWDTTAINLLREERSFHHGIVFISKIAGRKITVLKPRSYEMHR